MIDQNDQLDSGSAEPAPLLAAIDNKANPFFAVFFVFFVLGCLLYAPALNAPFVYDDHHTVEEVSLETLRQQTFSTPRRIVTETTFLVNKALHGEDSRGYHIVNIVIHILAAFGVFFLLLGLLALHPPGQEAGLDHRFVTAVLGGGLFLAHPLATQSVTYISQRYSSLAACFCIWSLVLFLRARSRWQAGDEIGSRSHLRPYLAAVAFAGLAILSKEYPVCLPVLILIAEMFFPSAPERRPARRLAYVAPFFLLVGLIVVLLYSPLVTGKPSMAPEVAATTPDALEAVLPHWAVGTDVSRRSYFSSQLEIIPRRYLPLTLLPWGQSIEHHYTHRQGFLNVGVLGGAAVLLALLLAAWRCWRSVRLVSFGILVFLLALAPTSSIIPSKEFVAEHRLYLSLLLAPLLAAEILVRCRRRAALAWALPLIAVLGALAVCRNTVWRTEMGLWADASRKYPFRARPYLIMGDVHFRQEPRDLEAAARMYIKFLSLDGSYAPAFLRLGVTFNELRLFQDAIEPLREALKLDPSYAVAHRALAEAHTGLEQYDEALAALDRWIAVDPTNPEPHFQKGNCLSAAERWEPALEAYALALEQDPTLTNASLNIAKVHRKQRRWDQAIAIYRQLLTDQPDYEVLVRYNLGLTFASQGKQDDAIAEYQRVLELASQAGAVHLSLAEAYARKGDERSAAQSLARARILGEEPTPEQLKLFEAPPGLP